MNFNQLLTQLDDPYTCPNCGAMNCDCTAEQIEQAIKERGERESQRADDLIKDLKEIWSKENDNQES